LRVVSILLFLIRYLSLVNCTKRHGDHWAAATKSFRKDPAYLKAACLDPLGRKADAGLAQQFQYFESDSRSDKRGKKSSNASIRGYASQRCHAWPKQQNFVDRFSLRLTIDVVVPQSWKRHASSAQPRDHNTVQDLLICASGRFSGDDVGYGFDDVGDVLAPC